jgi:hypothetical protein
MSTPTWALARPQTSTPPRDQQPRHGSRSAAVDYIGVNGACWMVQSLEVWWKELSQLAAIPVMR